MKPSTVDSDKMSSRELASDIKSRIHDKEWEVGDNLPTGEELLSQYPGIGSGTIHRARASLASQGYVETVRGRNGGTFIVSLDGTSKRDVLLQKLDEARRQMDAVKSTLNFIEAELRYSDRPNIG